MKFTSKLALAALFGRNLAPGPENWKDTLLKALIVKNEVLARDGMVREYLRKEIQAEAQGIESKSAAKEPKRQRGLPGQGFWANFVDGFKNG